jgi:hypothetical protein
MHLDDRLRIVACLANIGGQLNDLPDELSSVDRERLMHLMWMRDSLEHILINLNLVNALHDDDASYDHSMAVSPAI